MSRKKRKTVRLYFQDALVYPTGAQDGIIYPIMAQQKIKLTLNNIEELVAENKYEVGENKPLSRCIDGRYSADQDSALAYPGADLGELALVYATANHYGFEVDRDTVLTVYLKLIGGPKKFAFHTDHHANLAVPAGGCGFMKSLHAEPKTYFLEAEDIKKLDEQTSELLKKGAQQSVLEGDHQEGAVLLVQGNYGIYPQFDLRTDHGVKMVQVFIYHHTLVNTRHKELAKALIEAKAVQLPEKCDEEYLYQALSDVAEQHLLEIAGKLAKGLPIFRVTFSEDGVFQIQEEGIIGE